MDLPDNWEKIALVMVGAVFIVTVIYALNPYQGTPANDTIQQPSNQNIVPIPFPKVNKVNKSDNSSNVTLNITPERAKDIATQSNPGYTADQPIYGSVVVNNTNYTVWIVPLSKPNETSKTIYIDIQTGSIVLEI